MFENLVISYKCKTSRLEFNRVCEFENLVISYKCKTLDALDEQPISV